MGHMDEKRSGIHSMFISPSRQPAPDTIDLVSQLPLNDSTNHVYMTTIGMEGRLYGNQTDLFPVTSTHINSIVVVIYCTDPSYTKSHPIKLRHRFNLLKSYNDVCAHLRVQGYGPNLLKMDNKTYCHVGEFIAEKKAKQQYTPLDMHCTNIAKQCVCT